jgi:hypothetical protein
MTNNGKHQDDQALDAASTERTQEGKRDRSHEPEAMNEDTAVQLGALDNALATYDYPATTNDLVAEYGDHEIETQDGTHSVADVLARTDNQTFVSADDVRRRILGLIHR